MPDNLFPMKQNEQIETKCGFAFYCISKNEIELHYKGAIKLLLKQKNAETFYNILNELFNININLICNYILYANQYHCISVSKLNYNLESKHLQYQSFWIYFHSNSIKIQISMTFQSKFLEFYSENKVTFNKLMNTNEDQINSIIIKGINNPDRKHHNKISRYPNGQYHDWINFEIFDKEALSFLFEFYKELDILKP